MDAFGAEAAELSLVLCDLAPPDWARPTGCPPWNVADLVGHLLTVIGWLPGMLAAPAAPGALVTAVDYYRPDQRFSPATNARRVQLARGRAARTTDPTALAAEFDHAWREILDLCRTQPVGRVVVTRHGDPMLLTDFLVTRIVEIGIHGLDLAAALGRRPWLTEPASQILLALLLGARGHHTLAALNWDDITFLRKSTGREPLTADEKREIAQRHISWLTLG